MEQADGENKSLCTRGLITCLALTVPALAACEAINESDGALPPAPATVSAPVAPRAAASTPADIKEASDSASVPAAPYQTGQHDSAYSTYWQEAQRQGMVVTQDVSDSPSEFTQSYLNPDYTSDTAEVPAPAIVPAPRPVPAQVVEGTTSVVNTGSATSSSRYVTADGQPYPELDAEGLPVESYDSRATSGTTSVIPRSSDVMGAGSYGVHLASYRIAANAQKGWQTLVARHDALAGLERRVVEVNLPEKGLFLRLKAGPFASRAEAAATCREIKVTGDYCAVTTFDGVAF